MSMNYILVTCKNGVEYAFYTKDTEQILNDIDCGKPESDFYRFSDGDNSAFINKHEILKVNFLGPISSSVLKEQHTMSYEDIIDSGQGMAGAYKECRGFEKNNSCLEDFVEGGKHYKNDDRTRVERTKEDESEIFKAGEGSFAKVSMSPIESQIAILKIRLKKILNESNIPELRKFFLHELASSEVCDYLYNQAKKRFGDVSPNGKKDRPDEWEKQSKAKGYLITMLVLEDGLDFEDVSNKLLKARYGSE